MSEVTKKLPDLIPCPFCGRSDLVIINIKSEDDPWSYYAKAVFCKDCHCTGRHCNPIGWCESDLDAIEIWNTRKSGQRPDIKLSPEVKPPRYFFVCYELDLPRGTTKGHLNVRSSNGLFSARETIETIKKMVNGSDNVILTSVFEINKEEADFKDE